MNAVGRKPFVFDAVEEFTQKNKHLDFTQNSVMDNYRSYQDWTEAEGKKVMSYVSFSHTFKVPDAPIKQESALNLDSQFAKLKEYVGLVTDDFIKALFIHGEPGIGKTLTVEKMLPKDNDNYVYFSGGVRGTFELVKILYENRDNKVLIFDDFDSVFRTKTQIEILKKALVDSNSRLITWIDATKRGKENRIPERFEFTSSVIFISNVMKLDSALKSRCKIMGFNASKMQVLEFIHSKFSTFLPKVTMSFKEEVYTFMKENLASFKRIDFRIFKSAIMDRILDAKAGRVNDEWKSTIMNNIF